jgi:hypothetical protein
MKSIKETIIEILEDNTFWDEDSEGERSEYIDKETSVDQIHKEYVDRMLEIIGEYEQSGEIEPIGEEPDFLYTNGRNHLRHELREKLKEL